MDTLTTLYERLRQRAENPSGARHTDRSKISATRSTTETAWPAEPPQLEDWLRYWNDADTDLGNLRNLEHWLSRTRERGSDN